MPKRNNLSVENVVLNPVAHGVRRLYERSAPLLIVESNVQFSTVPVLEKFTPSILPTRRQLPTSMT